MSKADASGLETRVLVLAPVGRDAPLACAALGEHGLAAEACAGVEDLCRELERGAGAAFITREALAEGGAKILAAAIGAQPRWSDLPLIVLTRGGGAAEADALGALGALGELGNVTFIERPAHIVTVLSVVRSALRARLRQYEVRDQLDALARAKEERERLLRSEQAARLNAESNSRLKDEFLATVSHELRTPLTAIIGWTQILRRGNPANSMDAHALEVIERNGESQLHLIEDLLDVSRIISGKLLLDVRPVSLPAVIEAALDAARPAADAKGIQLRIGASGLRIEGQENAEQSDAADASSNPQSAIRNPQSDSANPQAEESASPNPQPPQPEIQVMGDADRLQQIVWNLVNNAVKFTPEGGHVEVRLARAGDGVEIAVSDTGAGIAPEFLPYVFDRFRQADAATTRAHGGLGLGLAIVRQLVELHGGTVAVSSAGVGLGATFTVRLPPASLSPHRAGDVSALAPADAVHSPEGATGCEMLSGLRVLVVDDEPDARELFAETLAGCGARVLTAASADDAVAVLERERPDVMVADIGMPGEDGYALIARVRRLPPERGGRTPAAALTAYARGEDRMRALRAGFQIHLSKPVKAAELITVIASLVGRVGAHQQTELP